MGTADGNLAVFEDKSVKVHVECLLFQNLLISRLFPVLFLLGEVKRLIIKVMH